MKKGRGYAHQHKVLSLLDRCNDEDRTNAMLLGIVGKRLTYETIGAQ